MCDVAPGRTQKTEPTVSDHHFFLPRRQRSRCELAMELVANGRGVAAAGPMRPAPVERDPMLEVSKEKRLALEQQMEKTTPGQILSASQSKTP